MICKNCNFQNVEDAIFCAQCGKRLDEKTYCRACNKEIPEDSTFCAYCGTPVGEIGYYQSENVAERKIKIGKVAQAKGVIQTVVQILLYAALCVMFICCFFFGFNAEVFMNKTTTKESLGNNSISFIIYCFKYVKGQLSSGDFFGEYEIGWYIAVALITFFVALAMVVTIVYFIVGTIKFIKGVKNKTPVTMSKFIILPAIINFLSIISVFGILKAISVTYYDDHSFAEVFLGAIPILNIVLCSALIFGAIILSLITKEFNKKELKKFVLCAIGVAVSLAFLLTMQSSTVNWIDPDGYPDTPINIYYTLFDVLWEIGQTETDRLYRFGNSLAYIIITCALFIAVTVVLIFTLISFIKRAKGNEKSEKNILIWSIILTVVSVAFLVFSCIFAYTYRFETYIISVAPICAVVFSAILLIFSIIIKKCEKIRQTQENTAIE